MSKIFLITLVVIILVNILTATPLLQTQVLGSIVSEDRGQSNAPPGVDPNECVPGNECPPECPEGFIPAAPPLNPQLGCIPNTVTSEPSSDESPERTSDTATLAIPPNGECPEGTTQASPPLNPQLGCIPNNETLEPNDEP